MKRGREDPPPNSSGFASSTSSPPAKKPSNPQAASPSPPTSSPSTSSNPRPPPPSSSSSATQGMPKVQDALGYLDKVKCFARGTLVRLYDGSTRPVEAVQPGLQLMGDDSTPRTVGHLTCGRAAMYRVTPALKSQSPFTVNGAHILVLRVARAPRMVSGAGRRGWAVQWWEVDTDNAVRLQVERLSSRAAAATRCAALHRTDASAVWEVAVDDFLRAPAALQRQCSLALSPAVTFVNAQWPRLQSVLSAVLGQEASQPQVEWAAWYLGLWLAAGTALSEWVPSGGRMTDAQRRVIDRVEECRQLFAGMEDSGTVPRHLLQAYGLLDNPHVPHAWLCDSLEVRRCILAGAADGSETNRATGACHISAQSPAVSAGYQLLASSLGLNSDVAGGGKLAVTSGLEDVAPYSVTGLKQRLQRSGMDSAARQCAFSLTAQGEDEYFGFSVYGGSSFRFLLADFTVTHNVSQHNSVANLASSRYAAISL